MLDLKWIRENPDLTRQGLKAKGVEFNLDQLLELDQQRRALLTEVEALKAKRNSANDEIAKLKKSGKPAEDVIQSMKSISQKIKEIDGKVGDVDVNIGNISIIIPNLPHKSVPVAEGLKGNKVVREWGKPRKFSFKPLSQLKLAEKAEKQGRSEGLFSMQMGSKITGSGYPVYVGRGAKLERALINFMIDFHSSKHGYTEVWPPAIVNRASMTGTGQLPKLENDMYALKEEGFFLIPTGEVPVTNLLRNETLKEEELPLKYVAYTPCFRREAGSYGKDTQGLSRVHQFDKVEMVNFVKPEDSLDALEKLVGNAEAILQALELPYRVVLLGSGDMSFAAAKCYDLEVWAPGSEKWFEVSSCSTFSDFQARRMNIKFKRKNGGKPELVHTLNGSGLALARIFLCLLENFQSENGEVDFKSFPKAVREYLK